jgi:hypothetical protein
MRYYKSPEQNARMQVHYQYPASLKHAYYWVRDSHFYPAGTLNDWQRLRPVVKKRAFHYKVYFRVWGRNSKKLSELGYVPYVPAVFVSPGGKVYRPMKADGLGIYLANYMTGEQRFICHATVFRAMLLGWRWLTEKQHSKILSRFKRV